MKVLPKMVQPSLDARHGKRNLFNCMHARSLLTPGRDWLAPHRTVLTGMLLLEQLQALKISWNFVVSGFL